MNTFPRVIYSALCGFLAAALVGVLPLVVDAGTGVPLYPDMFPYVEADAEPPFQTLQNWQLSGTTLSYSTLFANQGLGTFEIRRGADIDSERHELLQRVYLNNDFGAEYIDINIGTAPIPGTMGTPRPNDLNVIWLEDFSKFSLHEAPVVDGVLTVGSEVAGETKTSWRLSPNTGPLPGYNGFPANGSGNQTQQQRIGVGWADLYGAGSMGQSFDIAGVPLGPLYWLRQTVDPADRIVETDETNNSFEILIDLNNPGEAIMFAGDFVQPGDAPPADPGDLNFDGGVDLDDWLAFKAGQSVDLQGLDPADAYALGDLNSDGQHTLSDVALFRQYYDAANGGGAFAAIQSTPEPGSMVILGVGGLSTLMLIRRARRHGRQLLIGIAVTVTLLAAGNGAIARQVLFSEDFEGVNLGPNFDEGLSNPQAWTDTPPAGWTVDDTGVPYYNDPSRGVTEWQGWSFADKDWWSSAAGDQGRGGFDFASGNVAVADPDEWDDRGSPLTPFIGYYNAVMTTPLISLGGSAAGTVQLSFDSSWRDECCDDGPGAQNNQTALIRASYDGGQNFTEALRWESDPNSSFYKGDATNERVTLELNNPVGAQDVLLEFGLLEASNDWWWAIDNVEVFTPPTLVVNTVTGHMAIDGGADLTGYEITSDMNSLDPTGWTNGNLDARNYGSSVPATSDFNNDGVVDAADYSVWRDNLGAGFGGDANGDFTTDSLDYDAWVSQYGAAIGPGDSWETLIAEDNKLLEFFLGGSSTFVNESIGFGYDTQVDDRNLGFNYSTADGREFPGAVIYLTGARAVPEPATLGMMAAGVVALIGRQRGGSPSFAWS